MKKIKILIALLLLSFSMYAQFPGTDSLRNFNNRFITNDAKAAFTNLRLHNLIAGCIDWIDSARLGLGGIIGVDTIWAQTDSTIIYRKSGVFHVVAVKGTGRGQNIANAALTANGDYTQNWNHKQLRFSNPSLFQLDINETDLNGSGLKVENSIRSFPYWNLNDRYVDIKNALRNSTNTNDSLLKGFRIISSYSELYNSDFTGINYSTIRTGELNAQISVVTPTKTSLYIQDSTIKISGNDSIALGNAIPHSVSDSVYTPGPFNATLKTNTLYKVPKESLFNANHGVFKDVDSIKLGDSIHNHFNIIHYTNQKRYNPPTQQSGLILSNGLQMDTTIFAFPIFDTTSAANSYDKPLLAVGRYYNDNDSIYRAYGGSIQAVTRYVYDSNRTSFNGDTSIGMPISYGGINAVQQVLPPKSIHWNTTPFGSNAVNSSDLGIGGPNSYRIYSGSSLNGYPIAANRIGVDFARTTSAVKREMYGNCISMLTMDYRNFQSTVSSGTNESGSYIQSFTGLDFYGNIYPHNEAPSKAKVLAVSTMDTVRAFRIRPINTLTSEAKNGYTIWAEGSRDTMYHAGYVGIGTPSPKQNLHVFGKGAFSSQNIAQYFTGFASAQLYVVHGGSNYGINVTAARANTGGANISLFKTRNADASVFAAAQAGDFTGDISFQNVSGDLTPRYGASISSKVDSVTTTAIFSSLIFNAGQSDATEKMRINAYGNIGINKSTGITDRLYVNGTELVTDTFKLPNLITKLDTTNYKPNVSDANGNTFKMGGWPISGITSISGITATSQTLISGRGINVVSSGSNHTFSLATTIASFINSVNNSGTSETDLFTDTLPPNTLILDGESLTFVATGTNNDATATTQIQGYFAGNNIYNSTALSLSGTGDWRIEIDVTRTSSTTGRASVRFFEDNATVATPVKYTALTGLDWTTTNIFKITGTAGGGTGGSNDITATVGKLTFQP